MPLVFSGPWFSVKVKTPMRVVSVLAVALAAAVPVAAAAADFHCPETLTVTEQGAAPAGWRADASVKARKFDFLSVFDGAFGDVQGDLAPESKRRGKIEVLSWDLKAHREKNGNIWVRCRYADTAATLSINLPGEISRCETTVEIDKKGNVLRTVGMQCR